MMWKYCVLVRQDGPTQGGESLRRDTPYGLFYSGRTDNLHRGGVAVIVTRNVEKTLLEWKPVNDRSKKVRFNSNLQQS